MSQSDERNVNLIKKHDVKAFILVDNKKQTLAIHLFNYIPLDKMPEEPYTLSLLLSPIITAHDTDPLSFISNSNSPLLGLIHCLY
jgi:hypothetical protein